MPLPITDCEPSLGQVYTHPTCATQTSTDAAVYPLFDDASDDEAVAALTDRMSALQLIARRLDQLPPLPPHPSPLPPTPPPRAASAPPASSPLTAPSSCGSPVVLSRYASVVDLRRLYANNGLMDRVAHLMGTEVLELKESDYDDLSRSPTPTATP